MQADNAVELCREAVMLAFTTVGPVLLAGLVAGILAGLVQSLFQIHDQIAGFVPRVVVMTMVLVMALPWMSERLTGFGRAYFSRPLLLGTGTTVEPDYRSPVADSGESASRPLVSSSRSDTWPSN